MLNSGDAVFSSVMGSINMLVCWLAGIFMSGLALMSKENDNYEQIKIWEWKVIIKTWQTNLLIMNSFLMGLKRNTN